MDTIRPFSESISTGSTEPGSFFDPGDIQDDPTAKIAIPIPAKPAFEYKGSPKKPEEITINDLKKVHTPTEKVNLYIQMVGGNPKHRRGRWIENQKKRWWDDTKLLQHHGYNTDVYNTDLLNFIKKQDKRWLLFEKNKAGGITWDSVCQGLMKELGITEREAGKKLSALSIPEYAKRLSRKEKEVLKKYHAGDVIRAIGKKPMVGFGEFYHKDVGWY